MCGTESTYRAGQEARGKVANRGITLRQQAGQEARGKGVGFHNGMWTNFFKAAQVGERLPNWARSLRLSIGNEAHARSVLYDSDPKEAALGI